LDSYRRKLVSVISSDYHFKDKKYALLLHGAVVQTYVEFGDIEVARGKGWKCKREITYLPMSCAISVRVLFDGENSEGFSQQRPRNSQVYSKEI
jgi:hypothetical protein